MTKSNILIAEYQGHTKRFETCSVRFTDTDESYKELQKNINFCKGFVKMLQFSKIILISIRDKKGTYPALKIKFSEFMDEFMSQQPTSDAVCFVADTMKDYYGCFENYYDILK